MKKNDLEEQIIEFAISEPLWEEVIEWCIAEKGWDPWDIDLVKLADSFKQKLSKLKELDFTIPARVVVVAAILLRMKTSFLEEEKEEEKEEPLAVDEIPKLELPAKRLPSRRVTLHELVYSLQKAIRTERRRKERYERRSSQAIDAIPPPKVEDLEKRIDKLHKQITGLNKKELQFKQLLSGWTRKEVLDKFLPLLHLANEGIVKCKQPELFGPIYIELLKPAK